ncbi:MAG: HDIG domain-containing protein [Candidatus Omnitrophica bacterium]|nr:HDIG domain-containing protein [Candidatus Omnitrophota bacterium]HQP12682.1 HDIG domain-containing protein [Candidatus Omnitrophota bacterium]
MKEFIQTHVSWKDAVLVFFTLLILILFCQVVGFSLIIPLLLLFLGVHIFFLKKADFRLFLQLGLLLSLNVAGTNYIIQQTEIQPLFVPVASFSMLVMLLYNDMELAFLMAFISSVITSLLLTNSSFAGDAGYVFTGMDIMLVFFLGNLSAVYTVKGARTRGHIMAAGLYVSLIQIIAFLIFHHETELLVSSDFVLKYIRPLAVNGVISSFVVMATLKVFETWFGLLTNFSLLELADFNQPLLKRLILEAPGTYHHSLVVSNIAEAASDAVGANALLTRVGAYYHDVGKMLKPEYFTENQLGGGENKHDVLEANISRLVILNHVKEGQELARKYKLNPKIHDFIVQHHGTGLMYFFYQRALEDPGGQDAVKEDAFRYPGPKPQTKETAIVLLADSTEAATRALEDATPKKIEETVRKIINNKFIDGQLDECDLTLKEIELIALAFTRGLSAMYHSRVKYPDKKNGNDNRNQKPAEKSPSPSSSDSPPDPDGA